jgi:hypothetical protein
MSVQIYVIQWSVAQLSTALEARQKRPPFRFSSASLFTPEMKAELPFVFAFLYTSYISTCCDTAPADFTNRQLYAVSYSRA